MSNDETEIRTWSEENLRLTDTFDAIRANMRQLFEENSILKVMISDLKREISGFKSTTHENTNKVTIQKRRKTK